MVMKRGNIDSGRTETDHEYARRVQDEIDQDTWTGRDRVGCYYPDKAQVHDLPQSEEVHIYRQVKGE